MNTLFETEGNSLIFATHPRNHIEYDYFAVTVVGRFDSFVKYRTFLSMVETAIDAGASVLAVGRNVWKHDDPMSLLDAVEKVVFEEQTAADALGREAIEHSSTA